MKVLEGYAYDPSETKVSLTFFDGTCLEVFGFQIEKKVSFDEKGVTLHLMAHSDFVTQLIKKIGTLTDHRVLLNLIAPRKQSFSLLEEFNGFRGKLSFPRGELIASSVPVVDVRITK